MHAVSSSFIACPLHRCPGRFKRSTVSWPRKKSKSFALQTPQICARSLSLLQPSFAFITLVCFARRGYLILKAVLTGFRLTNRALLCTASTLLTASRCSRQRRLRTASNVHRAVGCNNCVHLAALLIASVACHNVGRPWEKAGVGIHCAEANACQCV